MMVNNSIQIIFQSSDFGYMNKTFSVSLASKLYLQFQNKKKKKQFY